MRVLRLTAVTAVAMGLLSAVWFASSPRLDEGTYRRDGGDPVAFILPMTFDSGSDPSDAEVTLPVTVGLLFPGVYHVFADDCLEALAVNDVPVGGGDIPFCDFAKGRSVDVRSLLHAGENVITARVHNNGGPAMFQITASWRDPLRLGLVLAFLAIGTVYGVMLLRLLRVGSDTYSLAALLAGGVLLRAAYTLATPYWVRGHDTDGHLAYIRYLADHASIPAADEGWVFYHPPLYYALGALWQRTAEALGATLSQVIAGLQAGSFLLSVGTLVIATLIARLLFSDRGDRRARFLFIAAVATLPSVVFFAPRINNDVLAQPLAFLTLYFLLLWWRAGSRRAWYGAFATIALHILTKSTGYLLLPVALLCLLLKRDWTPRRRLLHGAMGLLIILATTGWWSVFRYHDAERDTGRFLVGNIGSLNSGLRVPNDIAAFTTFHPVEIVRHPYNNAWSDTERRQYFWEYLYRSAFFGEFQFGEEVLLLARYLILLPLLLLPVAAAGLVFLVLRRTRQSLPLTLSLGALLFGHVLLRIQSPFSSSQDFRYSLLVLLPVLACLLEGMKLLPRPVSAVPPFLLALTASLSTMFLLAL